MSGFKESLLESIRTLSRDTSSLSAEIGQRLDSDFEFKINLSLKTLDTELELLVTAFDELCERLSALHDGTRPQQIPGILAGYSSCIKTITSYSFDTAEVQALLSENLTIHWFRCMFDVAVDKYESPEACLLYLSLLHPQPPSDCRKFFGHSLAFKEMPIPAMLPYPTKRWIPERGFVSADVTPGMVSSWISVFRLSMNNCEPEEYRIERFRAAQIRQILPGYNTAAADWPLYAEEYWSSLRPQIFALCNPTNRLNFAHWVLEYARALDQKFNCAEGVIDLTDALCKGDITPLHIAATLGLPRLCQDLISIGQDCNKKCVIGTPLWCAMSGPRVLADYIGPRTWRWSYSLPENGITDSTRYATPPRAQTIHTLLDSGASCNFIPEPSQIPKEDLEEPEPSMESMAIWSSIILEDALIIKRVIESGCTSNNALGHALGHWKIKDNIYHQDCESTFKTLAMILDTTLRCMDPSKPYQRSVYHVCGDLQSDLIVEFISEESPNLEGVLDDHFHWLVWSAMSCHHNFIVSRLSLDKRFDANCPDPRDDYFDTTMLHLAIGRDDKEMASLLLKCGGDLSDTDDHDRTPIMMVESVGMLSMLVIEHGARTLDRARGRTIWHSFAASNRIELLEWLCRNADDKDDALQDKSDWGNTPLAEAFLFIDTLGSSRPEKASVYPLAARCLLKHCSNRSHIWSTRPLVHLAAEWGELELIDGLVRIGADFLEEDEEQRTCLHWLNTSASVEVVKRLMELCDTTRIDDRQGLCPFQTIIANAVREEEYIDLRSQHPSSRQALSESVYTELLTPQMLNWQDGRGHGVWRLFMDKVLLPSPGAISDIKRMTKHKATCNFSDSVQTALRVIVKLGAMASYERQTGESAILCLYHNGVDHVLSFSDKYCVALEKGWNLGMYGRHVQVILDNSDPSLVEEFCKDSRACLLLAEAAVSNRVPLVRFLCSRGVPVVLGRLLPEVPDSLSPLESFLRCSVDLVVLKELLLYTTPEQLNSRHKELFLALLSKKDRHRGGQIVKMLFDAGMSPDPVEEGQTSILAMAIMRRIQWASSQFINMNANPYLGACGYNALVASVETGQISYLAQFLKNAPADYDWSATFAFVGREGHNILHAVAQSGSAEVAKLVLDELKRRSVDIQLLINVTTEDERHATPVHYALLVLSDDKVVSPNTVKDFLSLLRVLVENGADLTVRDRGLSNGSTPLHIAAGHRGTSIVEFLLDKEPRAAMMKDDFDKTPVDLAVSQEVIDIFKARGLV